MNPGRLVVIKLGRISYEPALEIQERLAAARRSGKFADTLLLLEHEHVITIGRRGGASSILLPQDKLVELGYEIHETSRGGDVTYHGPGQIVGYPVVDLSMCGRDVKRYVTGLQDIFVGLLRDIWNIRASAGEGTHTGVWVGNDKITAFGISVRHWVTMHGFAFNVNTDLARFGAIIPCGLADRGVTSLEKLTGTRQDMDVVSDHVIRYFAAQFGYEVEMADAGKLMDI